MTFCDTCGHLISRKHLAVKRFCSSKCRQKAWRDRKRTGGYEQAALRGLQTSAETATQLLHVD